MTATTIPDNQDLSAPAPAVPPVTRRISPAAAVTQTLTLAHRSVIRMFRNPHEFFDVALQPILFTLMFGWLFGGAVSGSVDRYLPLLIPGILAQTVLTTCMSTGAQLREDMDRGVFDRFRVLPIARVAPLAGPMVADLVRYTLATVLTIVVGLGMGWRPGGGFAGVAGMALLAILTGWSLAWVFTWMGTVAPSARAAQGLSMLILFPLTFLSNAFVQIGTLPRWLQVFVRINPVSHVISACRDLANEGRVSVEVVWAIAACVAVTAVFAPLSVAVFKRRD